MISIIIPVYNTEAYLGKCLKSILSQTYVDYELICVDDGSTDSSNKILREYEEIDNRVQIIEKEYKAKLIYFPPIHATILFYI